MEILDTSSKQCKILIQDGKKYVIRYPRKLGISVEYYRSTPEDKVIELLQKYHIRVPKLLHQGEKYSVQEYVEGQLLANKYMDHRAMDKSIIDQVVQQICSIYLIDGSDLLEYADWKDNKTFYEFQCHNTQTVFEGYYKKLKAIYDTLGISYDVFTHLYDKSPKIDNDRKMSIMHGDRHKKNAIISDSGEVVFIDWELGCIGDIAYDIAFHLHQMAYTKEDEQYFLKQLRNYFNGDIEKLLNDVALYRLFVLARSTLYHVYWTDLVYQGTDKAEREKQLGHFMRRYNRLCSYKEFNLEPKSEEELEKIFQEYRRRQESAKQER